MDLRAVAFLLLLACRGGAGAPARDTGADATDPLRVITFNTGTSEAMGEVGPDDGYGPEQAALSDQWYGDGLAWSPVVADVAAFLAAADADLVAFQEVFWTGDCPGIPPEAQVGFACEGWSEGDPTVAVQVLGEGWQVACHPGKPDKCAAVHERVGRFAGCEEDFCLEGLVGGEVEGCGSGARVARGVVERADGGEPFVLVSLHGSSGATPEDRACRVAQVEQVFVDLGDGQPAANGARSLILGDLNTDPGRWAAWDESAARWLDFAGEGRPFHFVSEVGEDAPLSYQGVADIDHVVSDAWQGACVYPGLSEGWPEVSEVAVLDHRPVVCDLSRR